jgi:STE24 endopeptidase
LLIAAATRAVVNRFGPRWRMSSVGDIASLPVLWGFFLLWGFASLPASNAISRNYEHQADLYGLNASQAPHGLAEFMIHDADTVRLQPTAIEYALFYTHPSDAERVATAMQWRTESARLRSSDPGQRE